MIVRKKGGEQEEDRRGGRVGIGKVCVVRVVSGRMCVRKLCGANEGMLERLVR